MAEVCAVQVLHILILYANARNIAVMPTTQLDPDAAVPERFKFRGPTLSRNAIASQCNSWKSSCRFPLLPPPACPSLSLFPLLLLLPRLPQQQPIAIEYQLKDSCDAARNLSTLLDRRCLTTATQSSCYYIQCVSKNVPLLLCLHPHREEALRDTFVWRLSRTSGLTLEQRGLEVAHVTRDSDTTFKVKRSKINLLLLS